MNAILNVMIKSLVVPFYKSHAGFLFFVFFVMFGIIESTQIKLYHESLIFGMLTSGIFMIVVLAVWLLYSVKSIHFILRTTHSDSYLFVCNLAAHPVLKSFWYFFVIVFLTFIPVFAYTLAIYSIAVQNSFYQEAVIVFLFQLSLWLISAWILNYSIRTKHKPSIISLPSYSIPFQQTSVGMYVAYLLKEEKSAVLLSKAFSLILIYLVKETLEAGDDFRIVGITWLFAMLSHTFLIQKIKVFEDRYLSWTRNLPIARPLRFFNCMWFYILLMIPESILLSGGLGKGLNLLQLVLLPIVSSGFFLIIHTHLYKRNRDPDQFVTYLFWLFIGCFMLVLSKLILALTVILLGTAFLLFQRRYYRYEKPAD